MTLMTAKEPLATISDTGIHVAAESVAKKLAKKNISPSLITGLEGCPARWFSDSFVLRSIIEEEPDNPARRGNLFHSIMEHLFALPKEERTTENMKKIADTILHSDDYADMAKIPAVVEWLRECINNYYRMGGRPEKVDVATLTNDRGEEKPGLEVFVRGKVGNSKRESLGFIDRLVVDSRKNDGSVFIEDWKGLALDTPLPTPTGWTTMGDVKPGDEVLGTNGSSVKVLAKSDVHHRPCYEVVFEDGERVVADNVHLWSVVRKDGSTAVLDTDDLDRELYEGEKLAVELPEPIEFDRQASVSIEEIRSLASSGNHSDDLLNAIRDEKRLGRSLRSSVLHRRELLGYLMVPFGEWNDNLKLATFSHGESEVVDFVAELIATLGMSYRRLTSGFLTFVPTGGHVFAEGSVQHEQIERFLLDRRTYLSEDWTAGSRVIERVTPVASVPTQCIKVNAENSLYLCGRSMVATHNTGAKAKVWNPKTKSTEGFSEARQQIIYAEILEGMGLKVSGARLIYPMPKKIVTIGVHNEKIREKVREDVEEADEKLDIMIDRNTFEFNPSHLCAWCPLAKICPEASIKPYEKMQKAFAVQPDPPILMRGFRVE